ncbi:hypothetical protein NWP21_01290 [Anabaenopsis sp. FSS-46]|uniref:hypothetical protein n=1 Tax=Anabaenopsis sp. FSS-46 TaxID=2971766 RepID=UPI0024740841|nr:hypothetical protein [Anabaenopsis sp. FSS-46]MDH6097498.1 hypothetical protein [Anabaenopsis sp. FSS-46]
MLFIMYQNRNRLLELEQQLLKSQKAAEQENQNKQPQLNEYNHHHHLSTTRNYTQLVPVKSAPHLSYSQLADKLQKNRPVTFSLPISSPLNLANFQDQWSVSEVSPVNYLTSNHVDPLSLLDELNPELELPITSSVEEAIAPVAPPAIQPKSDSSSGNDQNMSYSQLAQQLQAARLPAQATPLFPDREENYPTSDSMTLEAPEVTAIIPFIPREVAPDGNRAIAL